MHEKMYARLSNWVFCFQSISSILFILENLRGVGRVIVIGTLNYICPMKCWVEWKKVLNIIINTRNSQTINAFIWKWKKNLVGE